MPGLIAGISFFGPQVAISRPMQIIRAILTAFVGALMLPATASDFPTKAVHIIAPTPPGGGADILSHILQGTMQKALGQEWVVENKAGSRGQIGADFVAAAAPDGYTLLMGSNVSITERNASKLTAIVRVTMTPYVVAVNPQVAAKDMGELIAYAKKNPGKLRYGSSGPGSMPQLAAELFNAQAGIRMTAVASKGTNQAV